MAQNSSNSSSWRKEDDVETLRDDQTTLADDASTLAPTITDTTTTNKKDVDNTLLPPTTSSTSISGDQAEASSSKPGIGNRIKNMLKSPAARREERIIAQRPPPDPTIPKEVLRQREWYGKGMFGLPQNPGASSPGSQY
jgi:hypothetical protein